MAKLLDRPFTSGEKRQILDMLQGNINRISVSNDIEEIVCQLNFAVDTLSAVAYSRIKELTEKGEPTIVLEAHVQTSYDTYSHIFRTVEIEIPDDGKEWHVCGEMEEE